jgi:hypothetical protein
MPLFRRKRKQTPPKSHQMKNAIYGLGLLLFIVGLYSCNPECTSLQGLRVFPSDGNLPGYEIIIQADPLSSLRGGQKVFFNSIEVNTRFVNDFGLIATVPDGVQGISQLRIIDPDCEQVLDFDALSDYPGFTIPSPPQIVIPVPPVVFPADITKAWISPQDGDYCLWFGSYQQYFIETAPGDTTFFDTNIIDENSWEFSTSQDPDAWYHVNPVTGIVDTAANEIRITIDRTSKSLGKEEFIGKFVNIADIEPGLAGQGKLHLMWLTSQKTGRQLLVFKS